MGCATRCVAYLVLIFNLIFAIVGVGVVIVGILLQIDVINYVLPASVTHETLGVLPIVIIVMGGTIIITSLFGCFGVGKRGVRFLGTYIVILVILFVLKICLGLYVMFQVHCELALENTIDGQLQELITNYTNSTDRQKQMDTIQQTLHCCGVNGTSDWVAIPASCCEDNKICVAGSPELFAKGCNRAILDAFLSAVSLTYILVFSVSIVEIVGVIFTSLLIVSIRNDDRRERYNSH